MAKSQKKSTKEVRKPKASKAKVKPGHAISDASSVSRAMEHAKDRL